MNCRLAFIAGLGAGSMLLAGPSQAHHAVQASVHIETEINVKAKLTRVAWVNPHAWMYFEYQDVAGKTVKMAIETLGIGALRQAGIDSQAALQVGKIYDLTYYPNRTGEPGGFMARMVLPDGRVMDVRTSDPNAVKPATN